MNIPASFCHLLNGPIFYVQPHDKCNAAIHCNNNNNNNNSKGMRIVPKDRNRQKPISSL